MQSAYPRARLSKYLGKEYREAWQLLTRWGLEAIKLTTSVLAQEVACNVYFPEEFPANEASWLFA